MFEPPGENKSLFKSLDPRFRVAAAIICSMAFACLYHTQAALLALLLALLTFILSRLPLAALLKRLLVVNLFMLFLWLIVPLSMPGEEIWRWGLFVASRQGISMALMATIKSNAIVISFISLLYGLSPDMLAQALRGLGLPAKLVFLILSTCRYLSAINEEWKRLQAAARLRGFVPQSNIHSYRTIAYLFGLLLIRSFDRAERIHEAMLLRGFSGYLPSMAVYRAGLRDLFFSLLIITAMCAVIIVEIGGIRLV